MPPAYLAELPMKRDLIVLVADSNMKAAMQGVLGRTDSLRIHPIDFEILVHPERDAGCRLRGWELLRTQQLSYRYCLLAFDREGCGAEATGRGDLEAQAERQLSEGGWDGRSVAIVIEPELDVWMWSDSPHLDDILGWQGRQPSLHEWLEKNGHIVFGETKPPRPKETLEAAVRIARKARSSALYREVAERVSLERCTDPAFSKLRMTLRHWFPKHSTVRL